MVAGAAAAADGLLRPEAGTAGVPAPAWLAVQAGHAAGAGQAGLALGGGKAGGRLHTPE